MFRVLTGVSALAIALGATPAFAQRTDDNATAQAQDAFGTSVGDESIGIYNPYDVRGFSPVDAGNVRIEGLYFDQQTDLNGSISDGSTIRVGLSAQSYAFPAPTGIADFTLRKPGGKALASIVAGFGPWEQKYVETDVQLPIDGERLGFAGGVSVARDGSPAGITPKVWSAGGLVRWAPRAGTELLGFWSRGDVSSNEAQPLIFTSGAFLPHKFKRNEFYGQDWTKSANSAP